MYQFVFDGIFYINIYRKIIITPTSALGDVGGLRALELNTNKEKRFLRKTYSFPLRASCPAKSRCELESNLFINQGGGVGGGAGASARLNTQDQTCEVRLSNHLLVNNKIYNISCYINLIVDSLCYEGCFSERLRLNYMKFPPHHLGWPLATGCPFNVNISPPGPLLFS